MKRVQSMNTKPEIIVRSILHKIGYRFRLHLPDLPGRPDIVMRKHKKIIFVHGCFWHSHNGCKSSSRPSTNTLFWNKKLDGNIARDSEQIKKLEYMGWKVLVVWECQTSNQSALELILIDFLKQN